MLPFLLHDGLVLSRFLHITLIISISEKGSEHNNKATVRIKSALLVIYKPLTYSLLYAIISAMEVLL